MKKAMMYLLLALGITLFVMFVGGAICGFVLGFIGASKVIEVGDVSSMTYMACLGSALALILCLILNCVFLKNNFASYTIGRIPKPIRWKVFLDMIIAMAGMAVLFAAMNDVAIERGWRDEFLIESYAWMQHHPIFSILVLAIVEATADLIIYGAVIREILEWKHRPQVVILVYGLIMALISMLDGNFMLMIISMMMAQFEALVYEYTRSVIPIIIGDVAFWVVTLCLIGIPSSGWWLLIGIILVLPGLYLAVNPMEPYKPID